MRSVDFIEELHRFDLKQHSSFNDHIGDIGAHHNIVVLYFHKLLLSDAETSLAKFNYQSVLIDFFEKSAAKPVADCESAADYFLGHSVDF